MEHRFKLEGGPGSLRIRGNGLRVEAEAERPDDGRGLYKAYLKGQGGELLLGTMAPEDGLLRVRRAFSLDELRRRGVWPVLGGGARLTFLFQGRKPPAGWSWMDGSSLPLQEAALRQAAAGLGEVLYSSRPGCFQIAVPFHTDRAFPLPALFCLARTEEIGGRVYLIFLFDKSGRPVVQTTGRPGAPDVDRSRDM